MKLLWFAGILVALVVAVHHGPSAQLASGQAGEPEAPSAFTFARTMEPGRDALITISVGSNATLDVDFDITNLTPSEGQNSFGAGIHIFTHEKKYRHSWVVFYGHNRSAAAVWLGEQGVEAGPPILTMYRELAGADPAEYDWWPPMELEPGHYHVVLSSDHMTVDVSLTIDAEPAGSLVVDPPRILGDLNTMYITSNPSDWDEKNEVWLSFAGVVDAHLDFEVTSPLNRGFLYLGNVHHFEISTEEGEYCGVDDVWWPVEGWLRPFVTLRGISPGTYAVDLMRPGAYPDAPFSVFQFVEVPGHDDIVPRDICAY